MKICKKKGMIKELILDKKYIIINKMNIVDIITIKKS
jgi:hypothetical protein